MGDLIGLSNHRPLPVAPLHAGHLVSSGVAAAIRTAMASAAAAILGEGWRKLPTPASPAVSGRRALFPARRPKPPSRLSVPLIDSPLRQRDPLKGDTTTWSSAAPVLPASSGSSITGLEPLTSSEQALALVSTIGSLRCRDQRPAARPIDDGRGRDRTAQALGKRVVAHRRDQARHDRVFSPIDRIIAMRRNLNARALGVGKPAIIHRSAMGRHDAPRIASLEIRIRGRWGRPMGRGFRAPPAVIHSYSGPLDYD